MKVRSFSFRIGDDFEYPLQKLDQMVNLFFLHADFHEKEVTIHRATDVVLVKPAAGHDKKISVLTRVIYYTVK